MSEPTPEQDIFRHATENIARVTQKDLYTALMALDAKIDDRNRELNEKLDGQVTSLNVKLDARFGELYGRIDHTLEARIRPLEDDFLIRKTRGESSAALRSAGVRIMMILASASGGIAGLVIYFLSHTLGK